MPEKPTNQNDPPKGREARREERVRAMLDRGMLLLREGGLEGLTLQRLASSLGFVATSVYRYFPSKDALVAALQREAIARIAARMEAEIGSRRERYVGEGLHPTLGTLLAAAEIYLDLPETEPDAYALAATLLGDPRAHLSDDEAARTAPVLSALVGTFIAAFDAGVAAGELAPGAAVDRTLAYWGALHGALCMEKVRRGSPLVPPPRTVGMIAARALLVGFGARGLA